MHKIFERVGQLVWPYLELAIRLWIAKLFLSFGMQQLIATAGLSAALYFACSTLLAAGLMARYASLPLLVIAALSQLHSEPFDTQLFWIALFTWYFVHGAGPISLDHLLRRGLGDSAIPVIPSVIRISTLAKILRHAVVSHDAACLAGCGFIARRLRG